MTVAMAIPGGASAEEVAAVLAALTAGTPRSGPSVPRRVRSQRSVYRSPNGWDAGRRVTPATC
jgi:hypothetical protein